jgi:hypothetical protein
MPRELRTELETLIATGHCNWHTTVDVVLTGDVELHLSSGEIYVNRFGVTRQYLGKLENIQQLDMDLSTAVDQMIFSVANVDMVVGQTLTGADRRLDGARAVVGTLFIDRDDPDFAAGQHIYDARMPGELVTGEVSDPGVGFTVVSDVDSVVVAGRTIASEFQWREPISVAPLFNPGGGGGDLGPVGGGSGGGGYGGGGRYGDLLPLLPLERLPLS